MEKIDPLFPKTRIFMQKIDPFFENRGHTKSDDAYLFITGVAGPGSGHFSWNKIYLFYYIQVGYSGQKGVAQGGHYIRSALYSKAYFDTIVYKFIKSKSSFSF